MAQRLCERHILRIDLYCMEPPICYQSLVPSRPLVRECAADSIERIHAHQMWLHHKIFLGNVLSMFRQPNMKHMGHVS